MSLLSPKKFYLSLEGQDLRAGQQAVCVINTELSFTSEVQSEMKLAIYNKLDGVKKPVPLCQELCGISQDNKEKQFRIVFQLIQSGSYKVIVKLGETSVAGSPLTFEVTKKDQGIEVENLNEQSVEVAKVGPMSSPVVVPNDYSSALTSSTIKTSRPSLRRPSLRKPHPSPHQQVTILGQDASNNEIKADFILGQNLVVDNGSKDPVQYHQRLLDEYEVVKEIGLDLTLDLLEKEINKIKKNLPTLPEDEPPNNLIDNIGKQSLLEWMDKLPVPGQESDLVTSETNISLVSSPKCRLPGNHIVSSNGNREELPYIKPSTTSGSLDLASKPRPVKVFSVPMCKEKDDPNRSLHAPIGICILRNGNIVVASTFNNKVKMFSSEGEFLHLVSPMGNGFSRPSDMVCLRNGYFVVRDDNYLRLFTSQGTLVSSPWEDSSYTKCFGLAEDNAGHLVTIRRKKMETELIFIDIEAKKIVKQMSLEDIISEKGRSKCRFLSFQGNNLYITDLGLDQVYVIDSKSCEVTPIGKTGSGPGCFNDPAGLGLDSKGNMLVADSKNNRLCAFSAKGEFIGDLKLPEIRRPSGLVLEPHSNSLFVLNLSGKEALVKYKFGI